MSRSAALKVASCVALAFLASLQLGAGCVPSQSFGAVTVATGLVAPVFVAAPHGDPRLFVVERAGRIRIVDPVTGAIQEPPFLDIRSRVDDLAASAASSALAFAPDFAASGELLRLLPRGSGSFDSIVARFTLADPAARQANPATEEIVLRVPQPATQPQRRDASPSRPSTACCTSASATAAARTTSSTTRRIRRRCSARCCARRERGRRGLLDSGRQPLRRERRHPRRDLGLRPAQPVPLRLRPRDRRPLDRRRRAGSARGGELRGRGRRRRATTAGRCTRARSATGPAHPGGSVRGSRAPVRFTFPVDEYAHDLGCSITGGSPYRGASPAPGRRTSSPTTAASGSGRSDPNGVRTELTQALGRLGAVFAGIAGIGEDGVRRALRREPRERRRPPPALSGTRTRIGCPTPATTAPSPPTATRRTRRRRPRRRCDRVAEAREPPGGRPDPARIAASVPGDGPRRPVAPLLGLPHAQLDRAVPGGGR